VHNVYIPIINFQLMKIAVIGAGVFGCSAAIELSKKGHEVVIFERAKEILSGASTNNHLRHHYGYHYPRSKETALESINARKSFEKEYKECVIDGFPAYYAVAKEGSKSTPEQFLKFCDDLSLPYEIVETDPMIFNPSKISLCIKTPEPAYDPKILKEIILKKLKEPNISLNLDCEVVGGEILENELKRIRVKQGNKEFFKDFDIVISAIYSNFNKINVWFGFPKKTFRYDLMELVDVKLPINERVAAMVVDGDFCTFVPLSEKGVVRLGNSKQVFLKTVVSDSLDIDSLIKENSLSNKDKIISESIPYYPILKEAKYIRSTFVVRIIKASVESTDERPSETTEHGKGIFSIFGGKVITSIETAKKLASYIEKLNKK